MSKTFENGHALLVGVGNFQKIPAWSLPVTVKDVDAIAQTLTDPAWCGYASVGGKVRILTNEAATNDNILAGLLALADAAKTNPAITILVYFSGHGWVSPTGEYFLVTQNTLPGDNFVKTALKAEAFHQALRTIVCDKLLVIIDCCHAEGMASSKGAIDVTAAPDASNSPFVKGSPAALSEALGLKESTGKAIDNVAANTGRAVFLSARGNEESYFLPNRSMSIYTQCFIEALQGQGSRPGKTEVSVSDVMDYLSAEVPKRVKATFDKSQTPFFDFRTENFNLALIKGGKGISTAPVTHVVPGPGADTSFDRVELRKRMCKFLTIQDVDMLCDDLSGDLAKQNLPFRVSQQDIPSDTIQKFVLNLIRWAEQRQVYPQLIAVLQRERPDIFV